MKHGPVRGRRGQEGDFNGEEDVSTSNQLNERLVDDAYHSSEVSHDHEASMLTSFAQSSFAVFHWTLLL